MTFQQIMILIATIIAIAYILGFAYVSGRLLYFRRSLKKSLMGASIIMSQKKEVLLSLAKYFRDSGAKLTKDDEVALTKVRWLKTEAKTAEEANAANALLKAFEKRISYIEATHPEIPKGDELSWLSDALYDLNFNYRRVTATFNSESIGFNYWRKSFFYRPWFFLFRVKKRGSLN